MATARFQTNLGKALADMSKDLHILGNFTRDRSAVGPNDKYDTFKATGIRRNEGLARNAVSINFDKTSGLSLAQIGRYSPYGATFYSQLNDNKAGRLYEWRLMAGYSEITNALDNICNEFITVDDDGNVAKLKYTKPNAKPLDTTTLTEEFNYFIKLFNFKDNGYDYCWKYLTEAELFLELIVNDTKPEYLKEGVLGIMPISADLVDVFWKSKAAKVVDYYISRRPVYSDDDPTKLERVELVPFQANQLFYVSSGKWDAEGEYMIPFIERARRRYIQLSYIEDAIVIYRLVRAPERLIFTIPTGNLAPYEAEAYMKNVMDQYWKTKVVDINTQDITQKYNPQAQTDAYYFSKPQNGEAISVTSLKGADNLGELKDLEFFLRALYRDLKVPSTYLNPESQANSDPSQILVEQLRFADFITSIQKKFAAAIKQAFITHLKFKGLWEKYNLHENHLEIEFNQPNSYYLMRKLQITQMRNDIFNAVAGNEFISNIYALKKYFEWSDKDILANIAFLKAESEVLWEVNQRKEYGPSWKSMITGEGQDGEGGMRDNMSGLGGDMEGLGDGALGSDSGNPPDFGGGEAATQDMIEGSPEQTSEPSETGNLQPI